MGEKVSVMLLFGGMFGRNGTAKSKKGGGIWGRREFFVDF
jgi:hypothetical protein